MKRSTVEPFPKLRTGIEGFDHMSRGGLPEERMTLVTGTAGSGKTIFATQFLLHGIREAEQPAVFVTFEESAQAVLRDTAGFGWELDRHVEEGRLAFVDASLAHTDVVVSGEFDLSALIARIEHAVERIGARRVALDSMAALFLQFQDTTLVRRELLRIAHALKSKRVTTVLTAERDHDHGALSRHGVEEYVADNVVILRNTLEEELRRRTIEVFKMRGSSHQRGEVPFAIAEGRGFVVNPLSALELTQPTSTERVTSGDPTLDEMCGGGFLRNSVILVTGTTGTGKTLLTTEFVAGGMEDGERSLLFAFEESRDQLLRNATGWGKDLERWEQAGWLRMICRYPETEGGLEELQLAMRAAVDEHRPSRVAIDSLTALERISDPRAFREFVLSVTSFLKQREITGLFTSNAPTLTGSVSISDGRISTITDTILLLRYVEVESEIQRGLALLKMRGSPHDTHIRRYTIDGSGLSVRESFEGVHGILSGDPRLTEVRV